MAVIVTSGVSVTPESLAEAIAIGLRSRGGDDQTEPGARCDPGLAAGRPRENRR